MPRLEEAYVRLRVTFPEHPKIEGLSDTAFRLYVSALCYAGRNLTDGFIPDRWAAAQAGKKAVIAELVRGACWHEVEGGYEIHDYLGTQRSKEAVTKRSETNRKAVQARWEKTKGDTNQDADGIRNVSDLNYEADTNPVPTRALTTTKPSTTTSSSENNSEIPVELSVIDTTPPTPPSGVAGGGTDPDERPEPDGPEELLLLICAEAMDREGIVSISPDDQERIRNWPARFCDWPVGHGRLTLSQIESEVRRVASNYRAKGVRIASARIFEGPLEKLCRDAVDDQLDARAGRNGPSMPINPTAISAAVADLADRLGVTPMNRLNA